MPRNLILAAACLAFATPAFASAELPRGLARLSPTDFAGDVRIDNDPQNRIVLSTRDGYTRTRAVRGALADDVHLRAAIDRSTGRTSWQVWHDLAYVGGQRDLLAVHYRAGAATRTIMPLHVEHRPDRCPATDQVGACGRSVRVAFEVPEQTIREIARAYRPGARAPWPVRFEDTQGRAMTGGLAPAEVAGLLQAVEAWRNTGN